MMNTDDVMTNGHSTLSLGAEERLVHELRSKHGDRIFSADIFGTTLFMRPLTAKELEYRLGRMNKPDRLFQEMKQTVYDTCVHPERAELDSLIEKWPGFVVNLGNKVLEASGFVEIEIKKY